MSSTRASRAEKALLISSFVPAPLLFFGIDWLDEKMGWWYLVLVGAYLLFAFWVIRRQGYFSKTDGD